MEKKYKYQIESAIVMDSCFSRMLSLNDFDNQDIKLKLKDEKCHIYMICQRPRITIDTEKTNINKDKITLCFKFTIQSEIYEKSLILPNTENITTINSEYPYTHLSLLNNNDVVVEGKVAYIYSELFRREGKYDADLDLKVSYIGQAFGKDGSRVAADRINQHETLQKILVDISVKDHNQEVWILLWKFQPYLLSLGGAGFHEDAELGETETEDHLTKLFTSRMKFDQEITFTEAALIRYFQPQYNIEYKSTFPVKTHSSYSECYELDTNSVGFSLISKEHLYTRIYTDKVPPEFFHNKTFPLHSESLRKDMFSGLINED